MKAFIKRSRVFALALALALATQPLSPIATVDQAHAYYDEVPKIITTVTTGGVGGGSSAGGWIVGGMFVSVASIIACAMLVGAEDGRELTLEEALVSGLIPLGCLFREHLHGE